MSKIKIKLIKEITFCILPFFILGILSGCSSDDVTGNDTGHGVEKVTFGIESVSLEVGEQVELTAFLVTASGDTVDTADLDNEIQWEWWSSNPDVFTVDHQGRSGTIVGQNPGEEFCIVEVTILEGSSNFTGRDSLITHVF